MNPHRKKPSIEPLEPRIAPAAVSVTYLDHDGDRVKITASKGPLDITDLTLSSGATGQLRLLNLTNIGFQNADITFTVAKGLHGDGRANVGRIDATGRDLGRVSLPGDLGVLDAGDAMFASPGLRRLAVLSMGRYGLASQGGVGDLLSNITGALGALVVSGDFKDAFLGVTGGAAGTIGSVKIGGSLVGGTLFASGEILSTGDMGPVAIGRDVMGGSGDSSGRVISNAKLAGVSIGGSLVGGSGNDSGEIYSTGDIGPITIGRSVIGGSGVSSGIIDGLARVASVTIRGSLIGGPANYTGEIHSGGDMGLVTILRDVKGGSGIISGHIDSDGKLAGVTIGGSLIGGSENSSGVVFSKGDLGRVSIGRDVVGGSGLGSGNIRSGATLARAIVSGSLYGGSGSFSGAIRTTGDLGLVAIGRDIIGAEGGGSGYITSLANMAGVTIGGSLLGGTGTGSGYIDAPANLGPVKIGGDLRGGSGSGTDSLGNAGFIKGKHIVSVTVGGSIYAGIDNSTGALTNCGAIRADDDIGPVVVVGSLIGNTTPNGTTPVIISARGQAVVPVGSTTDIAIASLTVGGRVELAKMLGGFDDNDPDTAGSNGNAQIGNVIVAGDWIASSITAGVQDGGIAGFGNAGDAVINNPADAIIARIARITIGGLVIGTPAAGDHFGFVAQQIGVFRSLGFIAPLTVGHDPAISLSALTGDVTLREI